MNMSLSASVVCLDGDFGVMKEVLFDPLKNQATHFVVQNKYNKQLIIIPMNEVEYSSDSVVTIDKKANDFKNYPPLYTKKSNTYYINDSEYIDWGSHSNAKYSYKMEPYQMTYVPDEEVIEKKLPNGDIELKSGMCIKDTEGRKVGNIDEIIINKEQKILNIIIKTAHLLFKRNVSIEYKDIKEITNECITLSFSSSEISNLPAYIKSKPWK